MGIRWKNPNAIGYPLDVHQFSNTVCHRSGLVGRLYPDTVVHEYFSARVPHGSGSCPDFHANPNDYTHASAKPFASSDAYSKAHCFSAVGSGTNKDDR